MPDSNFAGSAIPRVLVGKRLAEQGKTGIRSASQRQKNGGGKRRHFPLSLSLSAPSLRAMPRLDGRASDQLRPLSFTPDFAPHATGSVLIATGDTRVICSAMIEESVPRWMKDQKVSGGWITAEYSMLPYSTQQRKARDISK